MLQYHWIPEHRDWTDREFFVQQRPRKIKVIGVDQNPPQVEDVAAAGADYVFRCYPLSENMNWGGRGALVNVARAREIGRAHAEYLRPASALITQRGIPLWRQWFEGINEPQVWTEGERPELTAAYYKAFLDGLHEWGGRGIVLNLGVGWPDNLGPDTPPNWEPFRPVIESMILSGSPNLDMIGLHEYWADGGPEEMWRWWAGRALQCPFNVPIIITEAGIDLYVKYGGTNRGWQALPEPSMDERARRYVDESWRYMEAMARDPRVQGIMFFTYDQSRQGIWWTFNVRDDTYKAALRAKRAAGDYPIPGVYTPGDLPPPPPPPPPPGSRAQGFDCSSYQGDINWDAVGDEYSFVMIRASAGLTPDAKFEQNYAGAKTNGLLVGAYHYLRQELSGQAGLFHGLTDGYDLELGRWADVEQQGLQADKVRLFCETLDNRTGETTHIYTRASFFDRYGSPPWVAGRKLWVAHYGVENPVLPEAWQDWEFWQYSNQGDVAGQRMDLNYYNGTEAELRAEYGQGTPPPPEDWIAEALAHLDAASAILRAHQ